MTIEAVIQFWFEDLSPKNRFMKSNDLDETIRRRFHQLYIQATLNELYTWRSTATGCLAEIIILDQFARNMFRDSPKAFQFDSLALALAQNSVSLGLDQQLSLEKRTFLYMPYMHSESLIIHEQAMNLFSQKGLEMNFEYEKRHKDIIEQFGRYPHRNKALNRESTTEEIVYLSKPGSSF
ncbi:MAG: DUF924 domain-containing protein [Candidatus Cloacimonetes bacterium]|nr:DUF924 domain-containing protein [Candidatus Cloacimonadota bacterium]